MGLVCGRSRAALALTLAVLCPSARGTHNEALCGVCKNTGLLGFQPVLPVRLCRHPERRQGVLALSSGLRDWLGLRRNGRQEKWKQQVTEVSCAAISSGRLETWPHICACPQLQPI